MTSRLPISDVKAMLVERIDPLVRALAPGVQVKGGNFIGKCPWRVDRHGGSFVVWRRGRAAGGWKDYATGESGDVIDLIAFVHMGANGKPTKEQRVEALRWAEGWLGLSASDPAARQHAREKAMRAQREAELREIEVRKRRRRRAHELWMSGKDWRDTPAETYLRARGIETESLCGFDDGIRFLARLEHWTERGFYGPALIAAMRHPQNGFAALHAVWLTPDGSGKAPINPAKLTLGACSGSAMRLTKGSLPSRSGPAQPIEGVPLAICEGPEDGLSVAAACPDYSVWAVGGLSNIGKQTIPAGTPLVVVCADNDWDKPSAQAALDKAIADLRTQGVPVAVARAHHGKDMNDLARFRSA